MKDQRKSFAVWAYGACFVALLALGLAAIARADEDEEREALIQRIRPSIVRVTLNGGMSLGSGCVVDATLGLVITNFHVVKGAKKVTVAFVADRDTAKDNKPTEYPVDGYIEVQPGKDLALLKVNVPKERKLKALKLAEKLPVQGEKVLTFGASKGLLDTVAAGMVSAIRTTGDVNAILQRFFGDKHGLGYDSDANWVQHDAPMSPGNSGGPLVNAKGEVVGLNTWTPNFQGDSGQRLNFSISSLHVRALVSRASNVVHPWSQLPKGGPGHESMDVGGGDADKTLAAWKKFNLGLFEFNRRLADADKRLESIHKPDPRWPNRGSASRQKQYLNALKAYERAYSDFALKTTEKAIDPKDVDTYLAKWIKNISFFLAKTAKSYKELCASFALDKVENGAYAQWKVIVLKSLLEMLHSEYDRNRVILGSVYDRDFPTPEETAAEEAKNLANKPAGGGVKLARRPKTEVETGYRVWTTADGRYSVEAKYLGITNDGQSVKLKKRNGKIKEVEIEVLCEADRSYIAAAREEEE